MPTGRKDCLLMILEFKIEAIKNERLGIDYQATREGFTERIKQIDTIVIGIGDK
jgi:hypothetical protein